MKANRIILHCTDSPNGRSVSIEEIRRWHTDRGFVGPDGISGTQDDVGYHAAIDVDGSRQLGRGFNQVGAHCEGENHDSIGICLVGTDRFTRAQWDALRRILDDICMTYGIRPWRIFCHYQFPSAQKQGKACPNIEINRILAWYLSHHEEAIWDHVLREPKN